MLRRRSQHKKIDPSTDTNKSTNNNNETMDRKLQTSFDEPSPPAEKAPSPPSTGGPSSRMVPPRTDRVSHSAEYASWGVRALYKCWTTRRAGCLSGGVEMSANFHSRPKEAQRNSGKLRRRNSRRGSRKLREAPLGTSGKSSAGSGPVGESRK